MRHDVRKRVQRRFASLVAVALFHVALVLSIAIVTWRPFPPTQPPQPPFVTHVFVIDEVPPLSPDVFAPDPTPRERSAPVRPAPITLPPEAPAEQASGASPRIDWAREAELSVSRQTRKDEDARRLAAPFSHDSSENNPSRSAPQFRWSRAHANRFEPLATGGTLIRLNDRCAIVFAGAVFPICAIGKIPVHGDLFEHMNDPPVLGEAPRPP